MSNQQYGFRSTVKLPGATRDAIHKYGKLRHVGINTLYMAAVAAVEAAVTPKRVKGLAKEIAAPGREEERQVLRDQQAKLAKQLEDLGDD